MKGKRHQTHHHSFVGFAGVPRQGQGVVCVVPVVYVSNLQLGFEYGGFECHDES
jgi:hypothetical protein